MRASIIVCGIACATLFAGAAHAVPQKDKPAMAPEVKLDPKAEAATAATITGKVVETMNAGGYSYVCLEKGGKKTWVAVPETKVSVGREMSFQPGQEMTNFNSKSLNRTFEQIIFSAGPVEKEAKSATPEKTAAEVPGSVSGKVVETMNAGGYTYVCLEKKGKKTWVAVPEMKVMVGKQMTFQPGQEMGNFTSKTLGRTFESIIFSGGPVGAKQAAAGSGATAGKGGGSKAASSPLEKDMKIGKAAGPDAYTVGEIYAKSASLNKKTAVLKAKVVKVSSGIMGKNWVHLQDGTGDPAKGSHNLVVTSQDLPSVGDVVTVKGTVYKDKDFGAGYKYPVIMEEASIQK